jgi:hypothetical protein
VLLGVAIAAALDARDPRVCRRAQERGADDAAESESAGVRVSAGADDAAGAVAAAAPDPRLWREMRVWRVLEALLPFAVQASVQALSWIEREQDGKMTKLVFSELKTQWDGEPHKYVAGVSVLVIFFYILFLALRFSCGCIECNPAAEVVEKLPRGRRCSGCNFAAKGAKIRRDRLFNFNSRRAVVDVLGPVAIWLQTFENPIVPAAWLATLSALEAAFVTCVAAEVCEHGVDFFAGGAGGAAAAAAAAPAGCGCGGGVCARLFDRVGFPALLSMTGAVTILTHWMGLYCTALGNCSDGIMSLTLSAVVIIFNVLLFLVLASGPVRVVWAAINSQPVRGGPPPPAPPAPLPPRVEQEQPAPPGSFSHTNPLLAPARSFGARRSPRAAVASADAPPPPSPSPQGPPPLPSLVQLPAEATDDAGRPLAKGWTRAADGFDATLYVHQTSPIATRAPPLVRTDPHGRPLAAGWYRDWTAGGQSFYAREDDPTARRWVAPLEGEWSPRPGT